VDAAGWQGCAAWGCRCTRLAPGCAGLLLAIPDLVALGLPRPDHGGRVSGASVIPATSWLLSLLALKLTGTRRVSHVDDLTHHGDTIAVTLNRRAYSPVLRQSDLRADTTVPWWQNRRFGFQFT
jgi:hypothetical protein